jgi:hypothetical protein
MKFKAIVILIGLICYQNAFLQETEPATGFRSDTSGIETTFISDNDILNYIQTSDTNGSDYFIGGQISSIFHEQLDSIKIEVKYEGKKYIYVSALNGLFNVPVYTEEKNIPVELSIVEKDYHVYDTFLILKKKSNIPILRINLIPKYKILLRGRIFAGNLPLEDVDVTIKHNDQIIKTKTLGCYYDSENYWNCLFNGMYKTEISADDPSDSLYLSFAKNGYKTTRVSMQFKNYNGSILNYKLRYADTLSQFPKNNLNLQLAFPVWLSNDWFVSLKYYRAFNIGEFSRLALGAEAVLLISQLKQEFPTFQGADIARVDSFYYTPFLGPSVLIWLTNPMARKFSTCIGNSFNVNLNSGKLSMQPFIESRYFLDMNKSVGIEVRYLGTELEKVNYTFNPYGNAIPSISTIRKEKLVVSIGIQVVL